ncbi:MAG: DNA-3-methyladenine glycosylase I [Undibacterium sp.]
MALAPVKTRCRWVPVGNSLYEKYHDTEWGRPVRNDRTFFEFLVLESAQAGLSWETILKRREDYRTAFAGFDPGEISRFGKREIDRLIKDGSIIRHRLKIESTVTNARIFLSLQEEFGSFSKYAWGFVGDKTKHRASKQTPVTSAEAKALAADLKRRGVKFFGPVIAYAFMQATGLVDDHEPSCFRYQKKH